MFTWPENIIPLPSFNFDIDVEFSNIRSKMESGRVRQRPRFSRALELGSVRFELTKQEFAWFKAAWVHKLNNGNDWFTMRLPIGNGANLTLSEIRFVSDFKANHRPVGNWDISATVEFKETETVSEGEFDLAVKFEDDTLPFQQEIEGLADVFPKDWTF